MNPPLRLKLHASSHEAERYCPTNERLRPSHDTTRKLGRPQDRPPTPDLKSGNDVPENASQVPSRSAGAHDGYPSDT